MKFRVAKTYKELLRLRFPFESFALTHDRETGETLVLWLPKRFFTAAFLIFVFIPAAFVVSATWWLQILFPTRAIHFGDVVNPSHWIYLLPNGQWRPLSIISRNNDKGLGPAASRGQSSAAGPNTAATATGSTAGNATASAAPDGSILSAYYALNGGQKKLLGIQNIQIQGNVTMADGSSMMFTFTKKMPDKLRIVMRDKATQRDATVLTDGSGGWKWLGDASVNGVQDIGLDEMRSLTCEFLYNDFPMDLINSHFPVHEIARPPGTAEPYNVVAADLPHDMRLQAFLDTKTWRADRLEIDYDNKGAPANYVIFVRDWMMVQGLAEPARIDVVLNGKPILSANFSRYEYSPYLLDSDFAPPPNAAGKPASAFP